MLQQSTVVSTGKTSAVKGLIDTFLRAQYVAIEELGPEL